MPLPAPAERVALVVWDAIQYHRLDPVSAEPDIRTVCREVRIAGYRTSEQCEGLGMTACSWCWVPDPRTLMAPGGPDAGVQGPSGSPGHTPVTGSDLPAPPPVDANDGGVPMTERGAFVDGLVKLAWFLTQHPDDVPLRPIQILHSVLDNDDDAGAAVVARAAAAMEVPVETRSGGHLVASLTFGPVTYEVCYIPCAARREHLERVSYETVVQVP